jgi:hypothetical protein
MLRRAYAMACSHGATVQVGRRACVCEIEHRDQGHVSRAPHGIPRAAPSATARLRLDPTPRTLKSGRSAEGILPAAPSRRLWCQQAARSFAVHGGAQHDGMCARRRLQRQLGRKSRMRSSSCGVAMHFSARSAGRSDPERKANLAGSCLPTVLGFRRAVGFDRHVLGQPVEHVGSVPANGLSTMSAPLGELSEYR